jgi:EmrB/QacA subfamily drug resistance transporter
VPTAIDDDREMDPAIHARRWRILGVLCLCLLVVMIANTSMNVALPILSRDLGASSSQLQWLVDSYSLVFAGLLFTAGAVGDRFGRKGILQAGLAVFALSSGLAATIVDSPNQLIAARALMGVGGALVMPATLSILTNVFPSHERAKAVGLWAGISGGGTAIGPVLTGLLLEKFSWHAVFAVSIPFVAVAMAAVGQLVPRSRNPERTPIDMVGAVLSTVALTSIVYALIEAPHRGWLSAETLAVAGGGLVMMAVFALWELRIDHPMLDIRLFRIPAFGVSSLMLTLVFFALFGSFFSMALLLQLIYGLSPVASAVRLLPVSVIMMVASVWATRLVARFGKRAVVSGGMACLGIGMGLMTTLGTGSSYPHLLVAIGFVATGMAMAMSPTTDLLMSAVPRARAGMGSAMNDTTRELGGSLGVAVFGSLVASVYASDVTASIAALPADQQQVAKASLAGGLGIAERTSGATGRALADAVREAWMSGFRLSMMIAGAIVIAAALLAWAALPDSAHDHEFADVREDFDPGSAGSAVGAVRASSPVTQAIPRS